MVVTAAAWGPSRLVFVTLVQSGKSKVVNDAARIPTLTFAVGAQFVVDTCWWGKVSAGAAILSSLKAQRD